MKYDFTAAEETTPLLKFPNKKLRARVIAEYVRTAGYRGVVVFTCGNAAAALRAEGLEVVEIGARGDLQTNKWWNTAEIHRLHSDMFDATSGHLPLPLMVEIGKAFRAHLGPLAAGTYAVPTGSGETVICLRLGYPSPDIVFEAAWDNSKPATERDPLNPLNDFVDFLFPYHTPLFTRRLFVTKQTSISSIGNRE